MNFQNVSLFIQKFLKSYFNAPSTIIWLTYKKEHTYLFSFSLSDLEKLYLRSWTKRTTPKESQVHLDLISVTRSWTSRWYYSGIRHLRVLGGKKKSGFCTWEKYFLIRVLIGFFKNISLQIFWFAPFERYSLILLTSVWAGHSYLPLINFFKKSRINGMWFQGLDHKSYCIYIFLSQSTEEISKDTEVNPIWWKTDPLPVTS